MWRFCLDELCAELFEWHSACSIIREQITEALQAFPSEPGAPEQLGKLPLTTALRYRQDEADRRKALDAKARGNLLAITLAFSILFTGFTFLTGQSTLVALGLWWGRIAIVLTIFGTLFLILGGMFALTALQIIKVSDMTPQNEVEESEPELVERIFWCVRQNQRETNLRLNALDISFKCIRNGIFLLFVLSILLAGYLWAVARSPAPILAPPPMRVPGTLAPRFPENMAP